MSAIALLHDHATFQNLQPLVTKNEATSSPPPTSWLVTEAAVVSPAGVEPEYRCVTATVPIGPFGSNNITTTSAFIDTDDGLIIVFQAPLGLHGRNQWRVVPTEDKQGLVLREEARLTGVALLMPFVLMTERKSHTEQGARFSRKLGDCMSASDSSTA
jgi:hypothetical protein